MKFFVAVLTLLAGFAVANPMVEERACLANGAKCKADGSLGSCCSKFCYQEKGKPSGKCQ